MNRVWVCLLMLALVWTVNFAGSSKPKTTFRIHVQTEGKNLSSKQAFPVQLTFPPETVVVSAIPELTEDDIAHVDAWPSSDVGQVLKIKFNSHGTSALAAMTLQDQGKIMVVILNGRIIYAPIIDVALNDGVLTIPRGALAPEVPLLEAIAKKNSP